MQDLSSTFAALGDATRFAIVERLLREGELSAGQLQDEVSISPPAVSRHLKVLRQAGIVNQRVGFGSDAAEAAYMRAIVGVISGRSA